MWVLFLTALQNFDSMSLRWNGHIPIIKCTSTAATHVCARSNLEQMPREVAGSVWESILRRACSHVTLEANLMHVLSSRIRIDDLVASSLVCRVAVLVRTERSRDKIPMHHLSPFNPSSQRKRHLMTGRSVPVPVAALRHRLCCLSDMPVSYLGSRLLNI